MANYNQLAQDIVRLVGGENNVISLAHCVTRLRFKLKNASLAKTDEIKKLDGVIKVMEAGGQYQVVIGTDVGDVYDIIVANYHITATGEQQASAEETAADTGSTTKEGIVSTLIDIVSSIFTPFLGAFTGAGLLKGFVVLFVTLGLLDKSGTTYTILNAAGDGVFYFLPIFLAYCAGNKFGAKPFISMAIAAALVYPNITALFDANNPIPVDFLGIPVKMVSYTSSVLPIIVVCFVQAKLEKVINRIIPKMVLNIFLPVLDLLILVPLTFIVIGPITTALSNGMSVAIQTLLRVCPPLGGALMAGLWPIMILFGIHWAIMAIGFNNLSVLGYDYLLPLTVSCNFSIAIAALAIFLKTRKKDVKQVAGPAFITALVGGVTEPAIYGTLLKYKKPMIMVCIANAVGGAICGAFNVTRDVQMSVNLLTLPAIWAVYGPWAIVAIAVVCVVVFVLTFLFGYNDNMQAEN